MIPLNIDNPEVLRRTLEEMEESLIVVDASLIPQQPLDYLEVDISVIVGTLNETIRTLNSVITILNNTKS